VIAPAHASLAGILIWTGEFDQGEQCLDRARRATPSAGEPGIQLLIHLFSAILPAARGQHNEALGEFLAAGQVQALMVGQHALTGRVTAWTIATQARLGNVDQARTALAAVDDRLATSGEIRNAAATIRLAEHDPAGARRELETVLDGSAPVNPSLTLIEAHLLDALALQDLGDERAARAAVEGALHLAEPDRVILPFAMTGAWELLTALPPQATAHAALVNDILDAIRSGAPGHATNPEPADHLSPTEMRVLRYLPTNLTRTEIAGQLSVSLNTINTHIRRIYTKLGATDRSSAVQRGRELRLLSSGRA
jgi:LuxR family maltose regulon positive regulatory protein